MAFQTTKRELGELYTFFRLLADGQVAPGMSDGTPQPAAFWPVALIERGEHDGLRQYFIEQEAVRIMYTDGREMCFPRVDFNDASHVLFDLLKVTGEEVEVPDALENFLDDLGIYTLDAQTDDRTDLRIAFWKKDAPLVGFVVRCRLSPMNPLLDGGRTANLKLEQTGVKFAAPTINKINALPAGPMEVAERMRLIERLGGVLKYSDVADRVFRGNLLMIDLHFPRMLTEMVRLMHLEGITRTPELIERVKQLNPLKIKEELIQKHGFYEYKMKQFLIALALGMRPAKLYRGIDSAIEGLLLVNGDGQVLVYHQAKRQVFADFLYQNSRFEKGMLEKDKYGFLERENGSYYFKLNAKIGLTKR